MASAASTHATALEFTFRKPIFAGSQDVRVAPSHFSIITEGSHHARNQLSVRSCTTEDHARTSRQNASSISDPATLSTSDASRAPSLGISKTHQAYKWQALQVHMPPHWSSPFANPSSPDHRMSASRRRISP
eukprot:GEMP01124649.1.p1 GENE.GEMP01124649.1~~GEMP01124649.1.p1  ORF type:complete len:132 (-),score=19.60 GEMP01124649.1:170-565(-)